ncbi:MAG: hypothetical protein JWQ48_2923, partial [Conexibacter sp.]|nr:hypothetical protein [Conexibacter sp.]
MGRDGPEAAAGAAVGRGDRTAAAVAGRGAAAAPRAE